MIQVHPSQIIEESFHSEQTRLYESLTATGNGYMGMRGNFEEDFSGDTHLGTYIGGVWFPDKTRVGWWKNGYPLYFGKVINAVRMNGIRMEADGETIDLARCEVVSYRRVLDMKKGLLSRSFSIRTANGIVSVSVERFFSITQKELFAIRCSATADYDVMLRFTPYLDGNVRNLDSNYDESFWNMVSEEETEDALCLLTQTKENLFGTSRFAVGTAMSCYGEGFTLTSRSTKEGYCEAVYEADLKAGETAVLEKFVLCFTDRDHDQDMVTTLALRAASRARDVGYETLRTEQISAWRERWDNCDVRIDGDDAAQQGIRFNLFQMLSTYSGEDALLNIGPKGFTGEKYGGATYWDTEAYCLPVYMAISGDEVAKQLLRYRYLQLKEAYENAEKLGLKGALYPMVTFTGVECHNEWEITFEEIHRNGAIAHAIFDYTTYTGDDTYEKNEGLDVLCGIARFYTDRAHYSKRNRCYMIHGVTGPNEYENNVNNNWYTNRIAAWSIRYFLDVLQKTDTTRILQLHLSEEEIVKMRDVSSNMYEPKDESLGIFVQHDGFLDKDLMPASDIPASERPINQHWSWDHILRSCFIKQADVLQGLYFLNHLYDAETIRSNFDFYEPMTVHESSLSPCVHSILASQLGYREKAVEMYSRTARLDLDNINHDTEDGLHITSMAGSWLSIAHGFAGMRTVDGLSLNPYLPECWNGYAFQFRYRGRTIRCEVSKTDATLTLCGGDPLTITLCGEKAELKTSVTHALNA